MDFYGFLFLLTTLAVSILSLTFAVAVVHSLLRSGLNGKLREELRNRVELWEDRDVERFVKRFLKNSD